MPKQQSKRRRKKYEAGSAYAGDVRPTGVLGFLSSANMVKIIFIGMALALAVGGSAAIFGGNLFRSTTSGSDFVLPEGDAVATAVPDDKIEVITIPQPVFSIDPNATYIATIRTTLGDIEVELLASEAPNTVNNFVYLANEGFYDGLAFYYVVSGFSAQTGDPSCTAEAARPFSSCGGGPGYDLEDDATSDITTGSLSMAGEDNGSQFFIVLGDSGQFDESASFGRIVSGLDVAEQLVANTEIQSIDIAVQ